MDPDKEQSARAFDQVHRRCMRERPVGSVAAPRRNTAWRVTMPKPLLKWRTNIWPLFSMCLLPSNLLDNIYRFFVGLGGL
jgi:hypothetical protein